MTYLDYVIGAYAVFALVLAWDFLAPRACAPAASARRPPPTRPRS